jgi:hypothetical protein
MKTLTIELPDELFAKLAALPVAERKAQAKHELVNGEYAQVVQDNFLAAVYEEIFADWVASQQPSTQEEAEMLLPSSTNLIQGWERENLPLHSKRCWLDTVSVTRNCKAHRTASSTDM